MGQAVLAFQALIPGSIAGLGHHGNCRKRSSWLCLGSYSNFRDWAGAARVLRGSGQGGSVGWSCRRVFFVPVLPVVEMKGWISRFFVFIVCTPVESFTWEIFSIAQSSDSMRWIQTSWVWSALCHWLKGEPKVAPLKLSFFPYLCKGDNLYVPDTICMYVFSFLKHARDAKWLENEIGGQSLPEIVLGRTGTKTYDYGSVNWAWTNTYMPALS